MNKNVKKIFFIDIIFCIIVAYTIFINLYVWEKEESIIAMSFFNLIYFIFRYFAYIFGIKLILKNKVKTTFLLSVLSMVFLFLEVNFILPHIENTWIWLTLIALPFSAFASLFMVVFNQIMSYYGKENDFDNYFSLKNFFNSGINIVIPLVASYLIFNFSFEYVSLGMIVVSLLCLIPVLKLPKITFNFESKNNLMKDVFKSSSTPGLTNFILYIHGFFLLLAAYLQQYRDFFSNILTFLIGENEIEVGFLKVGYFLLITLALILFRKLKIKNKHWYKIAIFLLITGMVFSLNEDSKELLLLACLIFAVAGFYFNTLYRSISFKLINNEDDYGKLIILFKREMIFISTKILFTLTTLFLSIETISDKNYSLLVSIMIIISLITVYFYNKLDDYAQKKE